MTSPTSNFVERAAEYRRAIKAGEIPACEFVKQACERADRDHANTDESLPFRFDADKANRVCRFMELLKHIQGPLAGTRLKLEPWQVFIFTEVFGWVWKDNRMRRYRRVYVEVGKGNGKSLLAAGITLYLAFAENEGGADAVCTATSAEQARIVLDTARQMVLHDVGLARKFGLEVKAHKIEQAKTTSRVRGLPSKASSIEGISLAAGIVDELHASKGREVFDNLRTACSKRPQALLFVITTAGGTTDGIGYEVSEYAKGILSQAKTDEQFFAIVYTMDENDEWTLEATWRKANPNFGVSVDARGLAAECNRAIQLASNEPAFLCKHLCVWAGTSGAEEPFLAFNDVRKCYDPNLNDDFESQWCALGADLASRLDLVAVTRVHSKKIGEELHYYAFSNCWLPAATLAKSKNASYQGWLRHGYLNETPGAIVDLEFVEQYVFETYEKHKVRDTHYDPLQSNMLVSRLQKRIPDKAESFIEIGQFAKYCTAGMTLLEVLVASGRLHTNNPILLWALGNLRVKRGQNGLLMPLRPKDREQKIDPAVALIFALRSCSNQPLDESLGNPYEERGVLFV